MQLELNIILRLLAAALFGSLIGAEREYRAKEAGLRTHFLVCAGAALFTIVSQFGFGDAPYDRARVAAQIVTGIGFLGAGTIVVHKRFVIGLTTAAGLWITAAIGMAAGGGLYLLAAFGTVLTLAGLETLRHFSHRLGRLKRQFEISFIVADSTLAEEAKDHLKKAGFHMKTYNSSRALDGSIRVRLALEVPDKLADPERIFEIFRELPAAELETIE